jgi:voltage-gated potassium channel
MESPGAEILIEDMFLGSDDLIMRYPLWLEGDKWQEVMMAMIIENLGTPLAYISKEGHVCVHPSNLDTVYAQSILMLVRTENVPSDMQVKDAFSVFHKKQFSA